MGASRILENGTLGGYSTICLARALPDGGRLVTLEAEPRHAEIARANIARAGLADRVEIRVGPALETLPGVEADNLGPFDLAFVDADKAGIPDYFRWALKLSRPGSLIVIDNVVRHGAIVDPDRREPDVEAIRRVADIIRGEPRVEALALQTVGVKGHDGLIFARVKTPG
jgi:predicted O-methyltransferase YrrM